MKASPVRPLFVLLVLASCGADPVGTATLAVLPPGDEGCSSFVCGGSNSPYPGFLELHMDPPLMPGRFLVIKFTLDSGQEMDLVATGAGLQGIGKDDGISRSGPNLVNSTLTLASNVDGGTQRYDVTIEDSHYLNYFEQGNDETRIESYRMKVTWFVTQPDRTRKKFSKDLCPKAVPDPTLPNTVYTDTLVLRGDQHDLTTGLVIATGDDVGTSFNFACAGGFVAKMFLIRHHPAANGLLGEYETSVDQRNAAARMFKADYCGDDHSNTELGQKLDWENWGGWNVLDNEATEKNVEAIWTKDRALCVTHPRHIKSLPCDIDPCTQSDIDAWRTIGDFITINPPVLAIKPGN